MFGRCVSAEAAAVFAALLELGLRNTCDAAEAAFLLVTSELLFLLAIVMSREDRICYGFFSDGFKQLKPRAFPRKGDLLPDSTTRHFNLDKTNIENGKRLTGETTLADWFDGPTSIALDEEVLGLGKYGYTLTVFSSEELPEEPEEYEDEEANLIGSYAAKFAYGR